MEKSVETDLQILEQSEKVRLDFSGAVLSPASDV